MEADKLCFSIHFLTMLSTFCRTEFAPSSTVFCARRKLIFLMKLPLLKCFVPSANTSASGVWILNEILVVVLEIVESKAIVVITCVPL